MADAVVVGCPEAKAALETALLDIVGQMTGLPIAELVGARHRGTVPLSFSVANPDLDDVARLYLGCEFYMPTYYAREDLLAEPVLVRCGLVHVPEGPGLGVTVDPDRLAKYRTDLLA